MIPLDVAPPIGPEKAIYFIEDNMTAVLIILVLIIAAVATAIILKKSRAEKDLSEIANVSSPEADKKENQQ